MESPHKSSKPDMCVCVTERVLESSVHQLMHSHSKPSVVLDLRIRTGCCYGDLA